MPLRLSRDPSGAPPRPAPGPLSAPAPLGRPAGGLGPSGGALTNLQILRALAAGLVLLHHVAVYGQMLRGAGRPFPALDDAMGVWGVALFFALSGFLMARLLTRDPPALFLAHRVSRIVPTYLGVVALFAALFAALGLSLGGVSVLALSLAPAGPRSYPLSVEWTLVLEMGFYVGLAGLAAAGWAKRLVPFALGWLVLLAAAFVLLPPGSRNVMPPPAYLLPLSAACMPFAGGLLLPRLISAGWIRPVPASLLALPWAAACLLVEADAGRWLGGIAAVLLVGAAVVARPVRRQGPARGLIALGDWSYVLYLVHPPMLMLAHWACPPHWPGPAYGALGVAGALLATVLLGPLDLALYRRLRRGLDGLSPGTLRRALAVFLAVYGACTAWGSAETARNDWAEAGARRALAALPAQSWASPDRARAAIAGRGLALSPTLRGAVESWERASPAETLVGAYAFDPAAPDRALQLALVCGGRLVALDRPRRMRKDLAGTPGFEALGTRRVGFRLRIPAEACPGSRAVAVAVDGDGRMAVLPGPPGE
jgi:peptidoglycan/LPS O-acetylase OafA/YrhL